jgi:hypothetical protein
MMPCIDDRDDIEREELQKRADKVTRLLCELMQRIETDELFVIPGGISSELREWWRVHKLQDRLRRDREEAARWEARVDREERIRQLQKELEELLHQEANS